MLEDKLLVWKSKRGSKDALCRIYEKYENDLLTLAKNLLYDGHAAEDVVQDVFLAFVRSLAKFHLRGSLKSYLAICAANRCRDHIRQIQRRRTVGLDHAEQAPAPDSGPAQSAAWSEELKRLSRALAQLPYEQREAIVLHVHGDLKFREIADLQQVSIKTAQSRYRYGLDKLRSLLLDNEV